MRVCAAILAAGRGTRFGGDKIMQPLAGKPVWRWSYEAFLNHPAVSSVVLVSSAENLSLLKEQAPEAFAVVVGGNTRQESSRIALDAAGDAEILLVHDAARPLISHAVIDAVIEAIARIGAAAPGVPVSDTIKRVSAPAVETLVREGLYAMQTPQGARTELLHRAHKLADKPFTDEMGLIESAGLPTEVVPGDVDNLKITTPSDLARARSILGSGETRNGLGYDVHRFSEDPSRVLYLGGVAFPGHAALDGHSDADALLHAVVDALLGAAALGDIGQHFPPSDDRWKGEPSLTFLRYAGELLARDGWSVVNVDASVIAESPKIMKRALEIREAISGALGIEVARVSVKATTNEGLGSIGRGEGIAAFATATIKRN